MKTDFMYGELRAYGAGHGALPVQLKANGVEIAICGGLGMGMS